MPIISFTKEEIDFLVHNLGALADLTEGDKALLVWSIRSKVLSAKHKSGPKKSAEEICPVCEGKGVLGSVRYYRPCNICNGTGKKQ